MSTLDDVRKNLKAGKPHVVTSVATPRATSTATPTSSKTDPLAAIRNKVKGSKPTGATPSMTAKQPLLADFQLDQLYQKGTQGKPPQIQHIAGLKAVYQAGLSGATAV
jgi:hypothetical protein